MATGNQSRSKSSTILTYNTTLSSLSSADGDIDLSCPLTFRETQHLEIQLQKVSFPTYIPNIYQNGAFNNGLVRISPDAGVTWTNVQLPAGVYSMNYISSAINTACSTWWITASDPGYLVAYNYATKLCYISIDSTKLAPAVGTQLAIDLSQSSIYELLGFPLATCTFITDGLHGGTVIPNLDWFGNSISVLLTNLGAMSLKNGAQSNELASVPLIASSSNGNIYLYPQNGQEQPRIPLQNSRTILDHIGIKFVGSRANSDGTPRSLLFMEGEVKLEILLYWSA